MASDQARPANRLARESSPYLLQHAHNPVDWYPWGDEAFAAARQRQVPIFLSIGYSTCYWCHVMERESFEDPRVGEALSRHFVCVKVDREERPDIDDIYMNAVQALTGRGGWPMSVFLTPPGARGEDDPGLEPFWAGTYFPPDPRHGLPSFTQVLSGVAQAWLGQRHEAIGQARAVADAVRERMGARASQPVRIGEAQIDGAIKALIRMYDSAQGGFGSAPKFPQPVFLELLLARLPHMEGAQAQAVRTALTHTLDRMALGGMFDQAGGGFHRYSVDARWLVPHFEKMLYDNAQLASLYARAAAEFGDAFYARVARQTLDYVRREMTSDTGAFFSAQDAEVDGREGDNYLWTPSEMRAAIGDDDHLVSFALRVYGLEEGPNFRDPHDPHSAPKNILFLADRPERLADRFSLSLDDFLAQLDEVNRRLYEARQRRKQPRLDDKTITSWNGLMIGAFADAAAALREPSYLDHARRAANDVRARLMHDDELLRTARSNGGDGTPAFLEDYAALALGLVRLHAAAQALQIDGDGALAHAQALLRDAESRFGDPDSGGFFDTRDNRHDLIVRASSRYDGAMPCGQSIMLHALLDLHEATGDDAHFDRAGRLLASMSAAVFESPLGSVNSTRALHRMLAIEPDLANRFAMTLDKPRVGPDIDPSEEIEPPVQVYSDVDGVFVSADEDGKITVELRIREGFHLIANQPFAPDTPAEKRLEGLIGLEVGVVNGRGVEVGVDYPQGAPYTPPGADGSIPPLMAHSGALRLDLTVVRTNEDWQGEPAIALRFQACTDRECLEPMQAVLDVGITER